MQRLSTPSVLALSTALLFALGGGFLFGRMQAPADRPLFDAALAPAGSTEERLTRILAIPDLRQRRAALVAQLDEFGSEDISSVAASFDVLRPNIDASAVIALMDWWVRIDPEGAVAYAGDLGMFADVATQTAVRGWAQQDPMAARAALEPSEGKSWHPHAVSALARGWAESGRGGVWGYVEGLPIGTLRQRAIGVLVHQMLLAEGPEAVARFAEAQTGPGAQRFTLQLFRQVGAALARQHPERAHAFAERHYEGPYGDALLFRTALSGVFSDAEGTASWLAALPASDAQADALRAAYGFWIQEDRESAHAWLRPKQLSPVLEPAWALLALDIGAKDPEQGLELVSSVQNEKLRENTTIAVGRMWYRSDPEAALAWLRTSALGEDAQQQIQAPASQRKRGARRARSDG